MVDLVAEGTRKQVFAHVFHGFAVAVFGEDDHLFRAMRDAVLAGNREAALCFLLLTLALDDARIDELNQFARLGLDDDHAAQHADLHGGKAHAVRRAHGLRHVVEQREDARRDFGDRAAGFAQQRVALFDDFEFSHFLTLPFGKCCSRGDPLQACSLVYRLVGLMSTPTETAL